MWFEAVGVIHSPSGRPPQPRRRWSPGGVPALPEQPGPLLFARDLVAAGYEHREPRTLAHQGALRHVRYGVYSDRPAAEDAEDRHRELVLATVPLLAEGSVLSHLSAAVLHGLPVPADRLDLVQVTRPDAASGRRHGYVHRHVAPLEPEEVTTLAGLAATSLARTVVDLARMLPFADAVAVADAALRRGLAPDGLDAQLEGGRRRPGVAAARRVVAFADGRSESAGESHSRVVLHRIGLPPTSLQHEVFDEAGVLLGRGDFGYAEHRTVGEFDGRIKYGRLLRAGQTAADAVYAEKRREDALRDAGWQVVRWSWSDLQREQVLAARLQRAFRRTAR